MVVLYASTDPRAMVGESHFAVKRIYGNVEGSMGAPLPQTKTALRYAPGHHPHQPAVRAYGDFHRLL